MNALAIWWRIVVILGLLIIPFFHIPTIWSAFDQWLHALLSVLIYLGGILGALHRAVRQLEKLT